MHFVYDQEFLSSVKVAIQTGHMDMEIKVKICIHVYLMRDGVIS